MIAGLRSCSLSALILFTTACNSDVPVSATTDVVPPGFHVAVMRVATHPFLARFNLKVTVSTTTGCSATSELFPDRAKSGQLFVVGQFDVRRFDERSCRVELVEFRSLDAGMTFLGAFDVDQKGNWRFIPAAERAERLFEKL